MLNFPRMANEITLQSIYKVMATIIGRDSVFISTVSRYMKIYGKRVKVTFYYIMHHQDDKCMALKTSDEWTFAYNCNDITTVRFNGKLTIDDISESGGCSGKDECKQDNEDIQMNNDECTQNDESTQLFSPVKACSLNPLLTPVNLKCYQIVQWCRLKLML